MKNPKKYCYAWNGKLKGKRLLIEDTEENRNEAVRNGATDFTIYSFDKEPTEENPYPVRYGNLVVDFDDKDDPYMAVMSLFLFCDYFYEAHGIDPCQYRFWLTGGKGAHLLIPAKMFGGEDGSTMLPVLHKKMLNKMINEAAVYNVDPKHIDGSLYSMGQGHLIRAENIRKETSGYKVRVFWSELKDVFDYDVWTKEGQESSRKKFDELWKRTEKPYYPDEETLKKEQIEPELNETLAEYFRQAAILQEDKEKVNSKIMTDIKFKECQFLKYCQENAEKLTEPQWFLMIRILRFLGKKGIELIHEFSKNYQNYSAKETNEKILHACKYRPPKCAEIQEVYQCKYKCDQKTPMQFIEKYLDSSQRVNLYFEPRDTNDKTAGLYYHPKPLENDEDELYICSYIEVMALTRDLENLQWGKEILLKDHDHFPHEVVINLEDFAGKGDEILRVLFSCGLILGDLDNAQRLLMRYLKTSIPEKRSVRVDRTGWHDKIYIIGEDGIGDTGDTKYTPTFKSQNNVFGTSGSLEDWQKNVADLCNHNSIYEFCIAAAFASVLLTPCGFDSFGLHLYGASSKGKTTIAYVAGSVCGGRDDNDKGFLKEWLTTSNALESIAVEHNDTLLILDEISLVEPKDLYDSIYMLMNNQGKARAKKDGSARKIKSWKTLVLSNGEQKISEKLAEDRNRSQMAGQAVRMIEIEAVKVNKDGIMTTFDYVPDNKSHAAFSDELKSNARKYYGTAIREFLRLFIQDYNKNVENVKIRVKMLKQMLSSGLDSSQVSRVITSISIVVAAGEMAVEFGIVNWDIDCFYRKGKDIVQQWINMRGGNDDLELRNFEKRIKTFFFKYENKRFKKARENKDESRIYNERVSDLAGYRWKEKDGVEIFMIKTDPFRDEILGSLNKDVATKRLLQLGWVLTTNAGEVRATHSLIVDGNKIKERGIAFIYNQVMGFEIDNDDEYDLDTEDEPSNIYHSSRYEVF